MPAPDRRPPLTRWAPALALALLLAAAALRTHHAWPAVFPGDGRVYLVDTDSYFHLRHASHFPRIVRDDPGFGYPRIIPSDAAGLYDLALGAASKLSGQPERAAAFAPVALYLASGMLLFALARRLTTPALAVWAVLGWVLYPGASLPVTTLGHADHHAAEIFCVLAVLLALHAALSGELAPALAALPLVAFLFTWLGAPLWVAILGVASALVLALDLARSGPEDAAYRAHARTFAVYGAVALAVAVALPALHPPLAMHARALRLAWVALGALALHAALHPRVARQACARVSRRAAAALALAVPLATLVVVIAVDPGSREVASTVLTPKTSLVGENHPIDAHLLWLFWGAPGVLALLAVPLTVARAASPAARLVPLLAAAQVAGLWLITRDYAYQSSPLIPLLGAVTLNELPATPRRALALVVALPLLMPAQTLRPWLLKSDVQNLQEVDAGSLDAAAWLREHGTDAGIASTWDRGNLIVAVANRRAVWARYPTPEAARWFSETEEMQSIFQLCQDCPPETFTRFVLVDAASVSRKFIGMASQAGRPLDPYRATSGKLEFEGRTYSPATYGAPWRRAVAVRLYYLDGETLSHYRLVYESPARTTHFFLIQGDDVARTFLPAGQLRPGPPIRLPSGVAHDISEHSAAKVFELVRGAMLSGKTAPGAPVELRLELEATTTHRRFTQIRQLTATPEGLWKCGVPYASRTPADAAVRALGPYTVSTLDASKNVVTRSVEVTEADVEDGRSVTVE